MQTVDGNVVEGRAPKVEGRWFSFPRSAWERTTWPLLGDCAQNSTQSVEVLHTHAECGNEWHVGESLRDSHSHLGKPRPHGGFTLIELLVAITIIGILAALVLGVASVAGETAREQHTRHVVERLHTLLTDFYGTFKTRRVRLRTDDAGTANGIESQIQVHFSGAGDGARRGQSLAEARLYAMREMMLMDIPDRWSDIIFEPIENFSTSEVPLRPLYLEGRTELSNVYYRRFYQLFSRKNAISGNTNTPDELRQNQGAECLYMVVTTACGDGEARTLFGENTIGDTDGDGAPEFLDGWGHPIEFLRWAPGFDSQIQNNANTLGNPSFSNKVWLSAAAADHDPFDQFRTDPLAFRLVPLIFSGGRDEVFGIVMNPPYVPWRTTNAQILSFNNTSPYIAKPFLSPFASSPDFLGTASDGTATDNVHNHLLGKR